MKKWYRKPLLTFEQAEALDGWVSQYLWLPFNWNWLLRSKTTFAYIMKHYGFQYGEEHWQD